jgi:hypothetical protein
MMVNNNIWLVVLSHPSEKSAISSVGMMTFRIFPINGKIKAMFQTTNQIFCLEQ